MHGPMAFGLIPLPARSLRPGMKLPYDVFDAGGKLLFARGQVLRDSPLVSRPAWRQPNSSCA